MAVVRAMPWLMGVLVLVAEVCVCVCVCVCDCFGSGCPLWAHEGFGLGAPRPRGGLFDTCAVFPRAA